VLPPALSSTTAYVPIPHHYHHHHHHIHQRSASLPLVSGSEAESLPAASATASFGKKAGRFVPPKRSLSAIIARHGVKSEEGGEQWQSETQGKPLNEVGGEGFLEEAETRKAREARLAKTKVTKEEVDQSTVIMLFLLSLPFWLSCFVNSMSSSFLSSFL